MCTAAQCTVEATGAVQWVIASRSAFATRAEPICEGHKLALTPLIAGNRQRARFLTMREYAARLAREQATVRVTTDDLTDSYQHLAEAIRLLRPNTR